MSLQLSGLSWDRAALDVALHELARAAGVVSERPVSSPAPPARAGSEVLDSEVIDSWLEAAAEHAGFEVEAVTCGYTELSQVLVACAPALIRVSLGEECRYLAALRCRGRSLVLLTAAGARERVPVSQICDWLEHTVDKTPAAHVEACLRASRIRAGRAQRARRALLASALAQQRIAGICLVRAQPGANFARELRRCGVVKRAALAMLLSLAQMATVISGWTLLGQAALSGNVEQGWLWAWALTLLSGVPCQVAAMWHSGKLATDLSTALKRRLLCGALRLEADRIRTQGSGRLLAMVSESETIEGAGLSAAWTLTAAFVQLVAAGVVIALGAGGAWQVALLVAWSACLGLIARRSLRGRAQWTEQRLDLARAFVENVLGNRTRVAQQPQDRWHVREDRALERYVDASRTTDGLQQYLSVLPSRGWFVLGFFGLIPAALSESTSSVALAVTIGGTLQAYAAFAALGAGASTLSGALIAWRTVGELYRAASAPRDAGEPALGGRAQAREPAGPTPALPVLELRDVSFRHHRDGQPLLEQCGLAVRSGERVLLEGPSGAGKSTLASLLVGARVPDSGQILAGGIDRATLGSAEWRRRVASVPQFHDNHILCSSLAFNLLMGRNWPPTEQDRRDANAVCQSLGLGPLLAKMPGGLNQIVGETGWQLSHGERSRVFLARGLLQRAEILLLDECFGALDPQTLELCVTAVRQRARTLIVIAHP